MGKSIITSISEKWIINSIHKDSFGDMTITVDTYVLIMVTNAKNNTIIYSEY